MECQRDSAIYIERERGRERAKTRLYILGAIYDLYVHVYYIHMHLVAIAARGGIPYGYISILDIGYWISILSILDIIKPRSQFSVRAPVD